MSEDKRALPINYVDLVIETEHLATIVDVLQKDGRYYGSGIQAGDTYVKAIGFCPGAPCIEWHVGDQGPRVTHKTGHVNYLIPYIEIAREIHKQLAAELERKRLERVVTTDTRPRRTIADVVANPPEGWHTRPLRYADQTEWEYNATALVVGVVHQAGTPPFVNSIRHHSARMSLAECAVAHRAVADLLDVLAEVSDV